MQNTDIGHLLSESELQQPSAPTSRAVAAPLSREHVQLLPFNPADHDLSWKCLTQIKLNRNDIRTIRRNISLAIGVNIAIGIASYMALKFLNLN